MPWTPMPETAVDEHNDSADGQNDVWLTRQVRDVGFNPKPTPPERIDQQELGLCPLRLLLSHT